MRPAEPTFFDVFDGLLLDMDGTLIHGTRAIEHAVEAVARARSKNVKIAFATNNASRTPDMVVEHLSGMGFEAHAPEVVNSPMVAASLLAARIPAGSTVLVVGGAGLVHELEARGFRCVREDSPEVAAVMQGFHPTVGWSDLAEAAYAIAHGALYVATNIDSTLPTEKGFAPGNGSLVAALTHATGVVPLAAGKPEPAMFTVAAESIGAARPLAVGDRLDTDLEGGNRAGIPTFHTLTGVSSWLDAAHAPAIQRPTYVRPDLSFLAASAAQPLVRGERAVFGATTARLEEGRVVISGETTSWRAAQAAITLVNELCGERQFEGEIVAEGGELFGPFGR